MRQKVNPTVTAINPTVTLKRDKNGTTYKMGLSQQAFLLFQFYTIFSVFAFSILDLSEDTEVCYVIRLYAFSNSGHTFALEQYPYRNLSHSKSSFNIFEEGSVAKGSSIT